MIYLYHVRLLMHFIGKKALNLTFFLYRSLGKMDDKVQTNPNQSESSMFHFALIKLLVLEKLKMENKEWESFLNDAGFHLEAYDTPKTRKVLHPVREKQPLVPE